MSSSEREPEGPPAAALGPPQGIGHMRTIVIKRHVLDLAALVAEPVAAGLDDLLNRQVLAHPRMRIVRARAKGKLKAP